MKSITRQHIELRRRAVFYEDALWRCNRCNKEGQYAQACDACEGFTEPWCRDCNAGLIDDLINYASTNKKGKTVERVFDGYSCKQCGKATLNKYHVEDIDLAADETRESYRVLPELGIQAEKRFEIFVACDVSSDELIRVSAQGITLRYGGQTRTFASALEILTRLDTSDYGHDFSNTLKISPPPPYDTSQRRTLQLLLTRLRLKLGSPIYFWSQGLAQAVSDDDEDEDDLLSKKIISWPLDPNREALALLNETVCDDGPGAFMNSFRLLELVLHRTLIDEVKRKRYDRGLSDDDFMQLLRTLDADLKTRMRHRIESLSPFPDQQLRRLWHIIKPGTAYDRKGVYEAVASFRNRHAHRPNEGKDSHDIVLPWETPNIPEFTSGLLDLIAQIM